MSIALCQNIACFLIAFLPSAIRNLFDLYMRGFCTLNSCSFFAKKRHLNGILGSLGCIFSPFTEFTPLTERFALFVELFMPFLLAFLHLLPSFSHLLPSFLHLLPSLHTFYWAFCTFYWAFCTFYWAFTPFTELFAPFTELSRLLLNFRALYWICTLTGSFWSVLRCTFTLVSLAVLFASFMRHLFCFLVLFVSFATLFVPLATLFVPSATLFAPFFRTTSAFYSAFCLSVLLFYLFAHTNIPTKPRVRPQLFKNTLFLRFLRFFCAFECFLRWLCNIRIVFLMRPCTQNLNFLSF